MRSRMPLNRASLLGVALLGLVACQKKDGTTTSASASAKASAAPSAFKPAAPVASGLPGAPERVSKTVNPENQSAYSGPTGSVRGVVTVSGDTAPVATALLAQIKGNCPDAKDVYG